jgi:LPS sulfotransferase NodH
MSAFADRRIYDLSTTGHDYPSWDGPPRRTILICTHPRSGSTLLGEAIHAAGGLGCPLEYFHRGFRPPFERQWGVCGIAAFAGTVHRLRTDPSGTLSVKLFWRDVEDVARELEPVRFAALEKGLAHDAPAETYRKIAATLAPLFPNPIFIHLIRRDRLRQAVSILAAEQSRTWRSIPGVETQDAGQEFVYDYERIVHLVAGADRCNGHWTRFFAALGQVPAVIIYEDLVADYAGAVQRMLHHLGRDAMAPPPRLRRQSDERSERLMLRFLREHTEREAG